MNLSNKKSPSFIILGASLSTGNLGVSALLASVVQGIVHHFPDARIQLLTGMRDTALQRVQFSGGRDVHIGSVGTRCNKTVWRKNHLLRLLLSVWFSRMLPLSLRIKWINRNPYLNAVTSARAVMDITGGDSFSDIYGQRRLALGCLRKFIVLASGPNLILLPQTYGPFKSRMSRFLARGVLRRAAGIYSRDRESLDQIRQLMGKRKMRAVPQLCPDVAFILEPKESKFDLLAKDNSKLKTQNSKLIGLNISGLLFNGGYTQNNQFGLSCDYKRLVKDIITYFARQQDCCVLLVPHVIPDNMPVENDLDACKSVWQSLPKDLQEKVIVVDGQYDQNEIKYIIGQCDFFLGSRMHATIAALSQCIPAVGLAYSKKFAGVFETVGVADSVVDMRNRDESEIPKRIQELYQNRTETQNILRNTIPVAQHKVLSIFDSF